jgi:cytochrome P450
MEKDIMDRCTKRILLPQNVLYWIPTHRNSKFNKKRSLVRGLLKDNVQERRSDCNETNDILNKIMEAHTNKTAAATTTITATDSNSNSTTLSDEDLIDILFKCINGGVQNSQYSADLRDISHQSTSRMGKKMFGGNPRRHNQQSTS